MDGGTRSGHVGNARDPRMWLLDGHGARPFNCDHAIRAKELNAIGEWTRLADRVSRFCPDSVVAVLRYCLLSAKILLLSPLPPGLTLGAPVHSGLVARDLAPSD